jgi:hypothetical protein
MASYSAAQVISPAIQRTKWYLFQPFRLGRFLKLTLVASLTEGSLSSCNFSSSFPGSHSGGGDSTPFHWPAIHWPALPVIVAIIALVCVLVIPLYILLSYLLIRLRFSYFDCVLYGRDRIAPAWNRYHRQALRYLGLTLLIGCAFWIVLIPAGYGLYLRFKPLFDSLRAGAAFHFSDFLPLIAIVGLGSLLLALVGYILEVTLTSFVLPRMALEDASIREALEDVWADMQSEPGQFLLFYFLRALLSFAASIVAVIALVVPFAIMGGIGAVLVFLLKGASIPAAFIVGIPLAALLIAAFVAALIGVGGSIGTFRRNYALLFYAGRFPLLGAILWPPQPPPVWNQAAPVTPVAG